MKQMSNANVQIENAITYDGKKAHRDRHTDKLTDGQLAEPTYRRTCERTYRHIYVYSSRMVICTQLMIG